MGKNDDMPRKESITFFEKVMSGHNMVKSCVRESSQIYTIHKTNGDKIKIYITDIYTIGMADYLDIVGNYSDLDAIITLSNWNSYTKQVKEEAIKNNFGIFVLEEFMGALNYDDACKYIKKDNKGKPIRFWRSSAD